MALNNLKTLTTTTAIVASVKLTATPANGRLGLGFEAGAYSADTLSPNPASERPGSRRELSEPQMRKQMHADGPDVPPDAGAVGCLPPGSRAVVSWSFPASANWSATATDTDRNRLSTVSVARDRNRRDCQSPARNSDKQGLPREVVSAATGGK